MKRILLGIFVIGIAPSYSAPLIKLLQKKFADAKAPTEADLKLGQYWDCKNIILQKNNYQVFEISNQLHFEVHHGSIRNSGSSPVNTFTYESTGIVGRNPDVKDGSMLEIRVNRKGDLIAEYSMPKSSLSRYNKHSRATYVTQAVRDPYSLALIYKVCSKR